MGLRLVVVTGLAGAGKSVALKALEDIGYYCIDNLPPALLLQTVELLQQDEVHHLAIGIDARSAHSLHLLPGQLSELKDRGFDTRLIFLEAKAETLLKRFSETRRSHPLARTGLTISECIALEREMLASIGELGHRLDTSELQANALRAWVRQVGEFDMSRLTLIFQSFGFKHGIPLDADCVFDARCLPNPYYDPTLRPLTGKDEPVATFLAADPLVGQFYEDVERFLLRWLKAYDQENRSYLTVAIGCTGGQHRSVYLAERLAVRFASDWQVLIRHREQH